MNPPKNNNAALKELLLSLLEPAELRDFIHRLPEGSFLIDRLPGGTASKQEVVSGAVDVLDRHGIIGPHFFEELTRARPRRRDEIEEVAVGWVQRVARVASSTRRLFLSYQTCYAHRLRPLIAALEAQGIDVWPRMAKGDAREALAGSHVLAVFATDDYETSPSCAWELASAWVAATRAGQAQQRVVFLLPAVGSLDPRIQKLLASNKALIVTQLAPTFVMREGSLSFGMRNVFRMGRFAASASV